MDQGPGCQASLSPGSLATGSDEALPGKQVLRVRSPPGQSPSRSSYNHYLLRFKLDLDVYLPVTRCVYSTCIGDKCQNNSINKTPLMVVLASLKVSESDGWTSYSFNPELLSIFFVKLLIS